MGRETENRNKEAKKKKSKKFGDRKHMATKMVFLVPFHPQFGPLPLDTTLIPPRMTLPKASKYEISRMRSARGAQLGAGAPATIPIGDMKEASVIACKEVELGTVPLVIRRVLPNRTCEDWCQIQQLKALHPELKNPKNLLTIQWRGSADL